MTDIKVILNAYLTMTPKKVIDNIEKALEFWHKAEVERIIGKNEDTREPDTGQNYMTGLARNDLRDEQRKRRQEVRSER